MAIFLVPGNKAEAKTVTLMAFGDSLTAGHGLPIADIFPTKLESALKKKGRDVKVIDSGVDGETSSDGLTRLDWTLGQNPDAVILELGGNDMLRALSPAVTRDNIEKILIVLKQRHITVLLAGMKPFANLGADYGENYENIYSSLAKKYGAVYYPFFLEGVALKPELVQDDGLHPNAAGVDVIVGRILPDVEKLLKEVQ